MKINLSVSNLPPLQVRTINIGSHQGVPVFKGKISYIAPNAAVGMIIDYNKIVHPFRFQEIFGYKGQTNMTMELDVGSEVEFAIVSDQVNLLVKEV